MTMRAAAFMIVALSAGCAATIGVQPIGPNTWMVSEMRAPVLGGGPAAQAAAMNEATGFCWRQGLGMAPLSIQPGGSPYGGYGPVAFTVRFQCVAARR